MYVTHHLNLIHIAIKFQDIPYGLPSYGMHKNRMKKKSKQREVTQKERAIIFAHDIHCYEVYPDIPYSY